MPLRVVLLIPLVCLTGCGGGARPTPPAALPGLSMGVRDSFYVVTGATVEELGDAMLAHGPKLGDVPTFALNEWEIRWRLQPARSPARVGVSGARNQCRIRNAQVDFTSRTLLPRWTPPADAAPELGQQWEEFVAALRSHEAGHHDLGVRAARNVLQTIRGIGNQPCSRVMAMADTAARQVVAYFRELNDEYDWVTDYGRSQGVRWPPPESPAIAR